MESTRYVRWHSCSSLLLLLLLGTNELPIVEYGRTLLRSLARSSWPGHPQCAGTRKHRRASRRLRGMHHHHQAGRDHWRRRRWRATGHTRTRAQCARVSRLEWRRAQSDHAPSWCRQRTLASLASQQYGSYSDSLTRASSSSSSLVVVAVTNNSSFALPSVAQEN